MTHSDTIISKYSESTEYSDKSEWMKACKAKGATKFETMPDGDIRAWKTAKLVGTWFKDEDKGNVY